MNSKYFTAVVLLAFVFGACSTQAAAIFPTGTFMTEEVAGSGSNVLTMVLENGHFNMISSQRGFLADGSYSVDGDKITFTEETTSPVAKSFCGTKNVYTYQWTYDTNAKVLHFKVVDDACSTRAGANSNPWKVAPSSGG